MLLKNGIVVAIAAKHPVNCLVKFGASDIIINSSIEPSMKIVRKNEDYSTEMGYSRLHLYIFVQESAGIGDYVLADVEPESICQLKDVVSEAYRLVATTNTKFPIARIPKIFLNNFVEAGGIDRTMVVYEEKGDYVVPKINSRGMILLSNLKDCYTGAEVAELFDMFVDEVCGGELKFKLLATAWKEDNI